MKRGVSRRAASSSRRLASHPRIPSPTAPIGLPRTPSQSEGTQLTWTRTGGAAAARARRTRAQGSAGRASAAAHRQPAVRWRWKSATAACGRGWAASQRTTSAPPPDRSVLFLTGAGRRGQLLCERRRKAQGRRLQGRAAEAAASTARHSQRRRRSQRCRAAAQKQVCGSSHAHCNCCYQSRHLQALAPLEMPLLPAAAPAAAAD